MTIEIRRARTEDYPKIVVLQKANQPANLTAQSMQQRGFVTANMDEKALDAINRALGVWVAVEGQELAGFVCIQPSEFLPRHPVIQTMMETFPEQRFRDATLDTQRVFVYGPVCVAQHYSGQGLLKR